MAEYWKEVWFDALCVYRLTVEDKRDFDLFQYGMTAAAATIAAMADKQEQEPFYRVLMLIDKGYKNARAMADAGVEE